MSQKNSWFFFLSLLISSLLVFWSCGQDYNSNSGDANLGQDTSSIDCASESGARFCAALTILQSKCISCHTHSHWAKNRSDAAWVSAKYIKPGNPDTSTLILKLFNSGGNMPQGGSALPDDEFQTLRTWIEQVPTSN